MTVLAIVLGGILLLIVGIGGLLWTDTSSPQAPVQDDRELLEE